MREPDHPIPHPDLAGHVLHLLEPDEERAFLDHLESCSTCRSEVEELRSLSGFVGLAAEAVEVPSGLRERTLAAVAAADPPELTRDAEDARDSQTRRRRSARHSVLARLSRPTQVLGVAAATIVVLFGVSLLFGGGDRQTTEFTLVASDGGPARGVARTVETDHGREVELEVDGLEPSPPGTHYECWFVAEGDTLEDPRRVSAGTFTVGASGEATVRLSGAVDLERYPKMGVTLEPDDGDPRRTGDKVLESVEDS